MKTVGIIGGLGPDTSAAFYRALTQAADRLSQPARPRILIWSVQLNYRVEREAIQHGTGQERIVPELQRAARGLVQAGADFLIMPCNSLHLYVDKIRQAVNVPVLSIIEETCNRLRQLQVTRVGLLGTRLTLQNNLYQNPLEQAGIECCVPPSARLEMLGAIIHRLVLGQRSVHDRDIVKALVQNLAENGAQQVLLACTDLQLLVSPAAGIPVLDTLAVLRQATLDTIFARKGCALKTKSAVHSAAPGRQRSLKPERKVSALKRSQPGQLQGLPNLAPDNPTGRFPRIRGS